MNKALAFFPWVKITEPKEVGPIQLYPWKNSQILNDLPHASIGDIDSVLGAYANRPGHPICDATLLEYDQWQTGTDVENWVGRLFRARELIGFTALSHRSLFIQDLNYCNYDTYQLVVQKYEEGHGGNFNFTTRQRDGSRSFLWSSDEPAFHRPYHVRHRQVMALDTQLLLTLAVGDKIPEHIFRSITDFNLSNTDSPDIPEHIELVMMKSAFESLFDIKQRRNDFVRELVKVLKKFPPCDVPETPLPSLWNKKGPDSTRLIECWANEFCDLRGVAAHGGGNKTNRFVWPEFWHLAFASILFPLLLKARLNENEKIIFELSGLDEQRLKRVERYLAIDPDSVVKGADRARHPWAEIDMPAIISSLSDLL